MDAVGTWRCRGRPVPARRAARALSTSPLLRKVVSEATGLPGHGLSVPLCSAWHRASGTGRERAQELLFLEFPNEPGLYTNVISLKTHLVCAPILQTNNRLRWVGDLPKVMY